MASDFVIQIDNLRPKSDDNINLLILSVFKKKLDITISLDNIDIEDRGDRKSAVLYLQSEMEMDKALYDLNNNGYRYTKIGKRFEKIYASKIEGKRPIQTHIVNPNLHQMVYQYNQYLGDESEVKEYKKGGGSFEDTLLRNGKSRNLAQYVCGFVNNLRGGTMYIGVNDDGKVVGFDCNHNRRDNIKRKIDQIMRYDLEPQITSNHYDLNFVPVVGETSKILGDLHVLEIVVHKVDKFENLYRAYGKVFERRKGTLNGPLKEHEESELMTQIKQRQVKEEHDNELRKRLIQKEKEKNDLEIEFRKLEFAMSEKEKEVESIREKHELELQREMERDNGTRKNLQRREKELEEKENEIKSIIRNIEQEKLNSFKRKEKEANEKVQEIEKMEIQLQWEKQEIEEIKREIDKDKRELQIALERHQHEKEEKTQLQLALEKLSIEKEEKKQEIENMKKDIDEEKNQLEILLEQQEQEKKDNERKIETLQRENSELKKRLKSKVCILS